MANDDAPVHKVRPLAARLIFAAVKILSENGREMRGSLVMEEVEKRVKLDDWAKETYKPSGYIRWKSVLHFYSIDLVKAGFMLKKKGTWFLTPEGEAALKLGETGLLESARKAYREWRQQTPKTVKTTEAVESEELETEGGEKQAEISADAILQMANDQIEDFVNRKPPYEFQDLVAALLRGMGYFTPFVAPAGKDGGVDVIAYRDPLGTSVPRIKVQIKHRESSASVQEVRQLMGLLQKDGDVGIFISSGGFTPDAKNTARSSNVHVELVDLTRFITLWQEFFPKLSDEDKARLPLYPIYLLAPSG